MRADQPPVVATLIEIGRRTANVAYLILSEKLGEAEPPEEVEVTMYPGARFRLAGAEARDWAARLSAFVPRPPESGRTAVVGRGGRRPKEVQE